MQQGGKFGYKVDDGRRGEWKTAGALKKCKPKKNSETLRLRDKTMWLGKCVETYRKMVQ